MYFLQIGREEEEIMFIYVCEIFPVRCFITRILTDLSCQFFTNSATVLI